MTSSKAFRFAALPLLLAGCVAMPSGPSVMALPGAGKTFEQFRGDDAECRQYALYQIGGASAEQAAADAQVRSAALGTVVGAVAGAAMGGHENAGAGAGAGLIVGSVAGAGAARDSAYASQRNYDHAYIQCMYAKGEQVSVPGGRVYVAPGAPAGAYYPPPPGYPPPAK